MQGLKRVIHYWSWISTKLIILGIGFTLIFGFFLGFMGGGGMEEFFHMTDLYLLLFGCYMGLSGQVMAAQHNLNQSLSMGASRRNSFIGLQYMNFFVTAVFFLLDLLFRKLAGGFYSDWGIKGASLFIMVIVVSLFVSGIGNALGVLIIRLGKKGMYIFCGVVAVFGGISGFIYAGFSTQNSNKTALVLNNTGGSFPVFLFIGAALLFYVLCSVLQYFIIRKYEIRI